MIAIGSSVAAVRGFQHTQHQCPRPARPITSATTSVPAPSNSSARSPARKRRICRAWRASASVKATVAPGCGSIGVQWNRGSDIAERYTVLADAVSRTDPRQVQNPVPARERRIRHRLPRARHLDRQAGRDQGAAPAEPRLRRSAARAPPARQRVAPEHRRHHHRREAGRRVLHRDGVRAGRDARDHRRCARARSTWAARSTTPARSATPSTTRTARASCTAICGRPTSWSRTPASPRSPTSARRGSSKSPPTAPPSSAARPTWRRSSSTARPSSPPTSTRWA